MMVPTKNQRWASPLGKLGDEGWELVQIVRPNYYFKKPKN
jgi:hypothetical protein